MGEHNATKLTDERRREFTKTLLADVQALDEIIGRGLVDTTTPHIGAEQEMFLVTPNLAPAPIAMEVLDAANDRRLTTELAKFNLEANLSPQVIDATCLRRMHDELDEILAKVRSAANSLGADVLLSGTLPTLAKSHLGLDNMTPNPRYYALNDAMRELRGGDFHVLLMGLDELEVTHDNVMFESCNTSFQLHLQVSEHDFARRYNITQAISGPLLAVAANSPVLLGQRLWHETRVALFQQSVDVRPAQHLRRVVKSRVSFGDHWVKQSPLEILRENISRFRVIVTTDDDEDPLARLEAGKLPRLAALALHNGTIYRWNRPCFGVKDNRFHLRIENRILPSGPTPLDAMANAAFFFGLVFGVDETWGDVTEKMSFDTAKRNFLIAAQHGLDAQLTWFDHKPRSAIELVEKELLPMARGGLMKMGIDGGDIDRYLGVIEERMKVGRNGARWVLDSLEAMGDAGTRDLRFREVTASMLQQQQTDAPVHAWSLAQLRSDGAWHEEYDTVGELMSTDLFTVRPDDLANLAASVMDWQHIRHVPVEDGEGRLVGIVTYRALLRLVAKGKTEGVAVADIMRQSPITVPPTLPVADALRKMRDAKVSCLPVVEEGRLVGIVTERDFIHLSSHLLERHLLK